MWPNNWGRPEPSAAERCSGNTVFIAMMCFSPSFATTSFFVKVTPEGEAVFPDLPKAPPYEGAKESFLVEDVEDRERLAALTRITSQALRDKQQKKGRK